MDKAKIEELRQAAKRADEAMKWRATGAYPATYSADPETVLAMLDHIDSLTAERDGLAAKLAELERQEPAWMRNKDCGLLYSPKLIFPKQLPGNFEPLYARPVPAAPTIPPDMILMPREPDETLVAGFVGCETRDEAKLGWAVAVRMQDVRAGTAAPAAPVCDCGDTIPNTPAAECEKYRSALAYLVDEVRSSGGLCPASACGYGINEVSCCRKDLKDALKASDDLLNTPASAGKGK